MGIEKLDVNGGSFLVGAGLGAAQSVASAIGATSVTNGIAAVTGTLSSLPMVGSGIATGVSVSVGAISAATSAVVAAAPVVVPLAMAGGAIYGLKKLVNLLDS